MRESLTVLAAIIVLIFTAALAGPYFVDWNAKRGFIERQLSEALGEPVTIHGGIDVKLLPTPYLLVERVDVADAAAPVGFSADRVRFEIAVAPLLRGEIDFIEARLQKPHLRSTLAPDGSLRQPKATPSLSDQLRFERISVADGALTIDDPANGRSFALDGLMLDAQASSLIGPFKGDGSAMIGGARTGFRFSTGAREKDRLRFKLIVDATKRMPRADVEGAVALAGAKPGTPGFVGTAALSGLWRGPPGADFLVPWRISGALKGDDRKLGIDSLELRAGANEHTVSFAGTGDLDLSATPKASLVLTARQLDIDKMLARDDGPAPIQRAASILRALIGDSELSIPPIPLAVEWTAESAALGGETLTDLSGAMSFEEDKAPHLRFEGNGPGRAHLLLDGEIETGSAAGFNGQLAAGANDLDKLVDWLAPALPAGLTHVLPFRSLDVAGHVALSRVGFSGRDLSLRFDRSTASGALAYTAAVGANSARLFADLTAPALDLDGLPDIGSAAALEPLDLSIRLAARAIKVARVGRGTIDAGKIDVKLTKTGNDIRLQDFSIAGLGGAAIHATGAWNSSGAKIDAHVDAARLRDVAELVQQLAPTPMTTFFVAQAPSLSPARLSLSAQATGGANGGALALTSLSLDGSAGATKIAARAQPDPKNATSIDASIRIDAPDAIPLLHQFGFAVLPFAGSGPGHVAITAHGSPRKELDASLSASLLGMNVGFAGGVASDIDAPHLTGAVKITSGDAAPFLQAAALAFPDPTRRLPVDLAGTLDWTRRGVAVSGLDGSIAGTPVKGALRYADDAAGHKRLTGAIDTDRWAFAQLAAFALGPPQPAKAGANWSSLPFAAGLVDPPAARIVVKAKRFDLPYGLVGSQAAMRVEIAPGVVALHDFSCAVGTGRATADLTLRRDGATAGVEGHVAISNFDLDLAGAKGRLKADTDLAGTGQSALALIAGLAASGHATIADLTVPHTDPTALARVFAAAETDDLSVDEAEVVRALRRNFDRAPLVVGTRHFDLGLAAGVLRLVPVSGAKAAAEDAISAAFDLRSLTLEERLGLTLHALPKDWRGPPPHVDIEFKGPLSKSVATIDASSFVNALAARAIARETARIQAYEFDVHERAVFNERLLHERREDQERLKAEDDARRAAELEQRKADEARRAAELIQRKAEDDARRAEAARLDRLKKAEEIRRKAQDAAGTTPAIKPPAALQVPAGPGIVTDPTAAGRY